MLPNKWEVVMKKQKVHEGAEENSKREKDSSATGMCLGLCIGTGLGIIAGVLMDDVGLGLCLGISTGMCVGLAAGSFGGGTETISKSCRPGLLLQFASCAENST